MENRRAFLKATIGALGAAATAPLSANARIRGANSRIRLAVIGCGRRSRRVLDCFARNADVQSVGGCEMVTDHRRMLDRKDIDAVLISTPDVSHTQIAIDALSAGKDVYVETPAANTVEHINAMLDASRKSKQIIQIGTEQRSGDHFAEAKRLIDSGVLGNIRHVAIVEPGSGLVGDRSADHIDVAHWFMNADTTVPRKTAAVGLFLNTAHPGPEQVPDTFSISWEYDQFVMTFANGEVPQPQDDIGGCGVFFIGGNGSLQINRLGYTLRPPTPRAISKQALPTPAIASVNLVVDPLDEHVRNFLACMRSRRKPNADMEVGYHSALPCLLALEAMQQNTVLGWDQAARRSRPI